MSLSAKFSPLLIGVLLLGGFVVYLNIPQEQAKEDNSTFATPVRVTTVQTQKFPITIEALGTAKANESVTITAQQTDVVTQVNFDDGDNVKAGQILVQLNDKEERARVEELAANINEAERQYERVRNLAQSSAASEQLLDEQLARVKTLKAQLDVANAQLSDLEVRAPFSGILAFAISVKGL